MGEWSGAQVHTSAENSSAEGERCTPLKGKGAWGADPNYCTLLPFYLFTFYSVMQTRKLVCTNFLGLFSECSVQTTSDWLL